MWQHNYTPLANNLALSSLAAALPIFVLLVMLGVARKPAWIAALAGLAAAIVVSLFIYRMPPSHTFSAIAYGAAQGLFPIGWVVFSAILLYNIVVKTGKFEIVKNSMGNLSGDRRLQALLIAFAFGAFIEGAAGFGTSVAVAAAMLTGLGFAPFYAGGICLLANTVPVTFCRELRACRSRTSAPVWAASAVRWLSLCRPTWC
jgi:L-lactate permease